MLNIRDRLVASAGNMNQQMSPFILITRWVDKNKGGIVVIVMRMNRAHEEVNPGTLHEHVLNGIVYSVTDYHRTIW